MGGLVSAEETQDARGRIDGTLTTCGLVAGALSLNNYQLDGEYALNELLAPGQRIQLVRYASAGQASAAATALATVARDAQTTPGRARVALAAALLNEPIWFNGAAPPAPTDYAAQEQQQADEITQFVLAFIMTGRYQIELAAGGNSSFTKGVDYRRTLTRSSFLPEVRALYRAAGLSLPRDLATLTRHATSLPTRGRWPPWAGPRWSPVTWPCLSSTSTPSTTSLVPVEQENWYLQRVIRAGSAGELRQAFTETTGHCNFQPAGYIAALHAFEHRLNTGSWGDVTQPAP